MLSDSRISYNFRHCGPDSKSMSNGDEGEEEDNEDDDWRRRTMMSSGDSAGQPDYSRSDSSLDETKSIIGLQHSRLSGWGRADG